MFKMTRFTLAVVLMSIAVGACAQNGYLDQPDNERGFDNSSRLGDGFYGGNDPSPQQNDDSSKGIYYRSLGPDGRGCEMFIKQTDNPNMVTDQAIYYKNSQGEYTADVSACEED